MHGCFDIDFSPIANCSRPFLFCLDNLIEEIQNRESESRAGCNFKCNIKYEEEFVKEEREYFESGIIQGDKNTK